MSKQRLEAFSDGVFAIAITLLVFNLHVPSVGSGDSGLARALGHEWPSYAAFVLSFFVIGIIWVNHHGLLRPVTRIDRPVLFANLLVLLWVVAIPFTTDLFAQYLRAGGWDARVAAAVYSAVMLLMGVSMGLLWRLLVRPSAGLLSSPMPAGEARASVRRFSAGQVFYVGTIVLSFVSAYVALVAHFLIALYYVVDQLAVPERDEGAPGGAPS